MRFKVSRLVVTAAFSLLAAASAQAAQPGIDGSPRILQPQLLDWPRETELRPADLTEPTSNRLDDLHGSIGDCSNMDMVFSTAGNYHMALRDIWRQKFLPENPDVANWYYSTSPPIAVDQVANQHLGFGNLDLECVPMLAGGPGNLMNTLATRGFTDGAPVPILRNRGNVILVKKGNPKHINSIWDLGRPDVRVVTSNPYNEKGSFGNYSSTIYNVAAADRNPPKDMTAEDLFNSIFNADSHHRHGGKFNNGGGTDVKWVAGARIHHREVPWAVAFDEADAGLMFYHLALFAKRSFPDQFDIVPLPAEGNRFAVMNVVRIADSASNTGAWTAHQKAVRERLIEALTSPEFGAILNEHGMDQP